MTLTSHAVAGAATAALASQNPVLAVVFGFLSHYLLDAIPHGHYPLRSKVRRQENYLGEDMTIGKKFAVDVLKIGADFALGIALAYLLIAAGRSGGAIPIMLGALAGTLPDALQFAYWKIRREPLTSLQKLHHAIHAEKNFNGNIKATLLIEAAAVIASVIFAKFFGG